MKTAAMFAVVERYQGNNGGLATGDFSMFCQKSSPTSRIAIWMALASIVFQPQSLLAEPLVNSDPNLPRVADVALQNNGVLHGQVLDRQGKQLPITKVQLINGQDVWTTYTDQEGHFRVEGLVGSTYQVLVGGQMQVVRVWAAGTAPPSAASGLLFIQDNSVVLGQHCGSPVCGSAVCAAKHPLSNPFILGGLVATAIAVPVAIHNSDDDDPPATNN